MQEVLLVGNPNAGKTTLFNSLTHSNEHVGNWHGVTVENKEKTFSFDGQEFMLVDTPGIYSLCPLSFEERVSVETILKNKDKKIINICDQNNLQRNLYLTLCLLECGCDVIVAINEIEKRPIYKVDCDKLSKILNVPVVQINAQKKVGIENLKKALTEKQKNQKMRLPYEKTLKNDEKLLKKLQNFDDFAIFKAFEHDENYFQNKNASEIFDAVPKDSALKVSKLRFDYVDQILKECTQKQDKIYGQSKLDKILLNKFLAFPIFLLILSGVFYLTFFSFGAFLSDLLGQCLDVISSPILAFFETNFSPFVFELFKTAIFGGVGTVLSFLPQVVLLFFFLSVLEDSGYLARIAFVFEDILGKIGLSGKSVYTLLMGFGCSTSAIMTSRNMEDKNAKIKTALLCPYMSCSAKIPIYTVIGGAFFGAKNIFVIIGLYLLGVTVAIAISKILDVTILKSQKQSFILEFPPYRVTSLSRVGKILWKNAKDFLIKVGSVMISMNIIIYLMSTLSFSFKFVGEGGGSMLESIGKFLAPVFSPLGFGRWAVVCCLLSGFVAKEVVVSSVAMFNGIDVGAKSLLAGSILLPTSLVFFPSKASVLAFLVFCLLYTPCVASVSMLLQEIDKKWTIFGVAVQLLTAYVVAFVTYQIAFACEIFGFWRIFGLIFAVFCIFFAIFYVFKKIKNRNLCAFCDKDCKNCKRK